MVKISLKRKLVLNRDQSLFGFYADYALTGPDKVFSKDYLSIRQSVCVFRYFIEKLIGHVDTGFSLAEKNSYIILSCQHEYLTAPNVESLIRTFAIRMMSKKCRLVIELDGEFPPYRSGIRSVLHRATCGVMYRLRDQGILFSIRCGNRTDNLTLQLMQSELFNFVVIDYERSVSFFCSESGVQQPDQFGSRVLGYIRQGAVKAIVDSVNSKEQFSNSFAMPFFLFCGDYLSPESITDFVE